ncbi:alpha/beta hydrolase [Enemella dayhoffiae]|uniref:Alpha/beta hydrolase n=1 Tax=Enemella dayhoffiae TaxID=2016507 RepID=A0A255GN23_9ACTN|nr:alpha/beta hydrolase [Enemella dayhoffiae]OYO17199.1 alpha/beta hydrolase [Enemella dayhoffiae]
MARLKRRRLLIGIAIAVALPVFYVGLNLALLWDPSPTGHWKSDAARQRFERAYADTMTLLPPPARTADVPTDFGTVRAYRFERPGADESYRRLAPLVLLPGQAAPTPMWLGNIPRLVAERPVIAIDLLGQAGLSVQTRPVRRHADQARWLDQALAGMGAERAHLLGVSFGGWTAVNLARHHPGRVASVSLLDPAFVFAPPKPGFVVAAMVSSFPLAPPGFTEWFTGWTAGGAPADDSVPEARVVNAGIDGYAVASPTPDVIPEADLRALRIPVWAVIAGRSVLHDARAAEARGRANVPGIEISIRPEATHAIHGELGAELDPAVLAFCAAHEPG